MELDALARGLAVSRIATGAGLLLAPGTYGRLWVGPGASKRWSRIAARSLGARELALGAGGLLSLRGGSAEDARRWFAAGAVPEVVDLVLAVAGPRTPARVLGGAMAAGSAAIAAAYAARGS